MWTGFLDESRKYLSDDHQREIGEYSATGTSSRRNRSTANHVEQVGVSSKRWIPSSRDYSSLGTTPFERFSTNDVEKPTMSWNFSIVKLTNCLGSFVTTIWRCANWFSRWSIKLAWLLEILLLFRRTLRNQEMQRESLQRDYLYLLQTALSAEDGRMFGGKKVSVPKIWTSLLMHLDRIASRSIEAVVSGMSTTGSILTFIR